MRLALSVITTSYVAEGMAQVERDPELKPLCGGESYCAAIIIRILMLKKYTESCWRAAKQTHASVNTIHESQYYSRKTV
jgi:hypothetical protein